MNLRNPELLPTVPQMLLGGKDFKAFSAMLRQAEVVELLSEAGPYTVFAPIDAAFTRRKNFDNVGALRELALHHVVKGSYHLDDLKNMLTEELTTLGDRKLPITMVDGVLKVGDAAVFASDFEARNGIIHLIDTLLIPRPHRDNPRTEGLRELLVEPPRS